MSNEIAKQVSDIKTMQPEEVTNLTVEVVEATKILHETNAEMDILSSSLQKLSDTKDAYDMKVGTVRQQLTDLAVKL